MKSPLRSLRGWFSGDSRRREGKNRAFRRRLRLEALETRRLLTADLAAIAGTVFVDLTDDGLTADDTRLEGVTVNLYRDGGNQQFEGDTTLLESMVTDSDGNYRFDNLAAGLYFVEQEAIAGLLQRPEEAVRPVEITDVWIDPFNLTPQNVSTGNGAFDSRPASEALGGHRKMFIELVEGPGTVEMKVMEANRPFLDFASDSGVSGRGEIIWDGGASGEQLDPTGLGGVDLTRNGTASSFSLDFGASNEDGKIILDVYSGANNYSRFDQEIPLTPGGRAEEMTTIHFADFQPVTGGGADFTNVGAIRLEIQGVLAMDAQFQNFATPTVITQDFANLNPLSLGDTVWFDEDNNGLLDPGEIGIPGVALTLYEHTDDSGVFNPDVDLPLANLTTDAGGQYLFTDLFPGDYIVRVDPANFEPEGALHEMVSSTAFVPPRNPNNNVDDEDNGYPLNENHLEYGVVSLAINLAAGGEPPPDPNTNLTLDFGFTRLADLQVEKVGEPNPVNAGDQLTYTVTVTNAGPSPAVNVVLEDTLPAGVTFDAAESDDRLVANGDQLTAELGTLAVDESMDVTIVVTVDSDFAGDELLNTAAVASDTHDPIPGNDEATETTEVEQIVALQINKTADLAQAIAGEQLVYTLQVTNAGPSDATGVTVEDTLPADVTFVTAANVHGAVTEAGGVVTAVLGDLPAGAGVEKEFQITVLVNPAADGTVLNNIAVVTANEDLTGVQAAITTNVIAQANLGITKAGAPNPVVAGNQLVYTLEVKNHGPSDATNVKVTDDLPAGVSFNATDHPNFGIVGNRLTVNIGDLAVGATESFTVTVDVAPATRGNLVNQAQVAGAEPDLFPQNDLAVVNTPVNAQINLVIGKTADQVNVVAGATLTYTLTVTNDGPSQATGVTVTDPLPAGLTFVPGSGNVDVPGGTVGETGGTMTAVLGNMARNAEATITFQATVDGSVVGPIVNQSFVAGQEPETNPADNVAQFTIQVTPPVDADVAITKQATPNPVVAGEGLIYTLTVTNNGPSPATGVFVRDQLPPELIFDPATSTPGLAFDAATNTVTMAVGNLADGATQVIEIGATVRPEARGTLVNNATVGANEPDSVPRNNQDSVVTMINEQANLEITKTGSDSSPAPGGALIYTLVVTNHGPSSATGVTIQDILPAGVDYVAGDNDPAFNYDSGVVGINVGNLAVGGNRQFQIHTQVQAGFVGPLVNFAQVWANEPDPVPGNNQDIDISTVAAQLSSLAGFVYVDTNRDGTMQADEPRLEGVTIHLTGTARDGTAISETEVTNADGRFQFQNLPAGVYNLRQDPPAGYLRGVNAPDAGVTIAGIDDDEFLGINLEPGVDASTFLFGHETPAFSKRLFLSSRNGLV